MTRQATAKDFVAIKNIKQALYILRDLLKDDEYRFTLQKNGFLLFSDLEKADFESCSMKNMALRGQQSQFARNFLVWKIIKAFYLLRNCSLISL